jgi:iron complex outermembrane receptor protein
MFRRSRRASASRLALAALSAPFLIAPAFAEEDPQQTRDTVVVTGARPVEAEQPATVIVRTGEEIRETTTVTNAEDALRYFPNILVRKRHIGDTQAPITTRTSGVGASARSLIYVDGVLISALIGNNNSFASPKWGMVPPDQIASVTVAYGPFSAAYAGNSIGAVVEIETEKPTDFQASLNLSGSTQNFEQYATNGDYGAWQASGEVGNKFGPFSFLLSANHTDSDSQPLNYVTATTAPAGSTGAFADFNRLGQPISVLGAGGLEHQEQDNITLKLGWDITDDLALAYTVGRFTNETTSDAETYLSNTAGAAVFTAGFSSAVYGLEEEQWSHSLSLTHSDDDGVFEWKAVASLFDYATSEQRTPSALLPAAASGGAGSITRMDGTGWRTLDLEAVWRPHGRTGAHEVSFGAHGDEYELANSRFAASDWLNGAAGALAAESAGKTQTTALWVQDTWRINDALTLTTGGRYEWWEAKDGRNYSASPALNVNQPGLSADEFSPKASLEWAFAEDWSARASIGRAYRFPTVAELYQAIATGVTLTVPNPSLRPENALSTEFALVRALDGGEVRLSIFTEDLESALISQSAPLVAGSTQLFNYVQNVDKVESRGVELVASKDDVLIPGLSFSGSVTYVEATTVENNAFPASEGKRTPQVPEWRATLVTTYRPNDAWSFTLAGRYVDRTYGTLDNSDTVSHTYQGFEGFMVWDIRAAWRIDGHWTASAGVENVFDADYFLFHPFPQRAATVELGYRF